VNSAGGPQATAGTVVAGLGACKSFAPESFLPHVFCDKGVMGAKGRRRLAGFDTRRADRIENLRDGPVLGSERDGSLLAIGMTQWELDPKRSKARPSGIECLAALMRASGHVRYDRPPISFFPTWRESG